MPERACWPLGHLGHYTTYACALPQENLIQSLDVQTRVQLGITTMESSVEKVGGSWILLLDSLNNKSSNAFSSYLLYKKYVSQNTSSEHVLHEPSVCTWGGILQEVVNSFTACMAQDGDPCLETMPWPFKVLLSLGILDSKGKPNRTSISRGEKGIAINK